MERSLFWPDVNGDREYDGNDTAEYAGSFVTNGVYNGDLAVSAGGNMSVSIPAGRAWVGPAWKPYKYINGTAKILTIANADGVLNRKDTVVLRWDVNTRDITAQVLIGAFASSPVAPAIIRTAEQYDLKLAEISVAAGTTAITQAMITDTRLDKTVCGIVTGVISQVDTTALYDQIQADLASFKSVNEADFTVWVNGLKDILDENTAGNLLNLINNHKADGNAHISTYTHTKTGTVHNLAGTGNNITFLAKFAIADGDTWTVNGQPVTATLQNGDPLPGDLFKAENWVTGVRLDGTKLGFKAAGGGKSDFNIFCQPTLPVDKFDGITLLTPTTITPKKVVFDTNPYTAESFLNPSGVLDMPIARVYASSCVYGTEIFILDGGLSPSNTSTNTVIAYNTLTNTYRSVGTAIYSAQRRGYATIGTKVYMFGGLFAGIDSLSESFDIITLEKNTIASYPQAAELVVCATDGIYIYCFGGHTTGGVSLLNAYKYTPSLNTYSAILNLTEGRYAAIHEHSSGEIFFIGGTGTVNINTATAYNISSNTYRLLAAAPYNLSAGNSTIVGDEIFIFGGTMASSVSKTIAYSITLNTYRDLSSMVYQHPSAPVVKKSENFIYIFSGNTSSPSVDKMSLTPKQYPDNNTVIMSYLNKDTTHSTNLVKSTICDYIPTYFKDAMLFQDSNILFPALYRGNGTSWSLIRAAQ